MLREMVLLSLMQRCFLVVVVLFDRWWKVHGVC